MAYRGDDANLVFEAPTAKGPLRMELAPRQITLSSGGRTLQITDQLVTIGEAKNQESLRIPGRLLVARDVPHDDLAVWIELADKQPGMRRIFGVEPLPLLEPGGLEALERLDALFHQLRAAVADLFLGSVDRRSRSVGGSTRSCSSTRATTTRSTRGSCFAIARGSCSRSTKAVGS